jgi:hypothetical protein
MAASEAADALGHETGDDDPDWLAADDHADELAVEVAECPISGAEGLALKAYLAIQTRDGSSTGNHPAGLGRFPFSDCNDLVVDGLVADLTQFAPELEPLCRAFTKVAELEDLSTAATSGVAEMAHATKDETFGPALEPLRCTSPITGDLVGPETAAAEERLIVRMEAARARSDALQASAGVAAAAAGLAQPIETAPIVKIEVCGPVLLDVVAPYRAWAIGSWDGERSIWRDRDSEPVTAVRWCPMPEELAKALMLPKQIQRHHPADEPSGRRIPAERTLSDVDAMAQRLTVLDEALREVAQTYSAAALPIVREAMALRASLQSAQRA